MFIQRLAWLAFQGGVVASVCYALNDAANQTGEPVNAGAALTLGVGAAYAATLLVSLFLDAGRVLRGRARVAPVERQHVRIEAPRRSFGSPW